MPIPNVVPIESNALAVQAARQRLDAGAALSKSDLALLIGLSSKSVDRLVATGKLPEPDLRFNLRTIRWSANSVRKFIDGSPE
jgi:hypothetical protein